MRKISHHNFHFGDRQDKIEIEKYTYLETIPADFKKRLNEEIQQLLINCWGTFPENFVELHIFKSHKMITARIENKCVGVCVMTTRNVLGKKIHYMEFLLIDKKFQMYGLGSFLTFSIIKDVIIRNILSLFVGKPLEIFFITPNIRVLSRTARFASFIYPNPYLADSSGCILPADQETWDLSLELLKGSDNPGRKLERQGLILHGSYVNTPWLIYNNDTIPWHYNQKMNIFADKYLGYQNGEDKEFMVRAHINMISVCKYLLHIQ